MELTGTNRSRIYNISPGESYKMKPKQLSADSCQLNNETFPGGKRRGATPVPIPNTEVKPSSADGTALATVWESRLLPGLF